jgi:hypothetical protein
LSLSLQYHSAVSRFSHSTVSQRCIVLVSLYSITAQCRTSLSNLTAQCRACLSLSTVSQRSVAFSSLIPQRSSRSFLSTISQHCIALSSTISQRSVALVSLSLFLSLCLSLCSITALCCVSLCSITVSQRIVALLSLYSITAQCRACLSLISLRVIVCQTMLVAYFVFLCDGSGHEISSPPLLTRSSRRLSVSSLPLPRARVKASYHASSTLELIVRTVHACAKEIRDFFILLLMFLGFLRESEVTALGSADVFEVAYADTTLLYIFVEKAKNDQARACMDTPSSLRTPRTPTSARLSGSAHTAASLPHYISAAALRHRCRPRSLRFSQLYYVEAASRRPLRHASICF